MSNTLTKVGSLVSMAMKDQELELEARFSLNAYKLTDVTDFLPGIPKSLFNMCLRTILFWSDWSFLPDEMNMSGDAVDGSIYNKRVPWTRTVESFYKKSNKRETKYSNGSTLVITKESVEDPVYFDIFSQSNDKKSIGKVKVSLSLEKKCSPCEEEPVNVRVKTRSSFVYKNIFRIDFTGVVSADSEQQAKRKDLKFTTFEIECELINKNKNQSRSYTKNRTERHIGHSLIHKLLGLLPTINKSGSVFTYSIAPARPFLNLVIGAQTGGYSKFLDRSGKLIFFCNSEGILVNIERSTVTNATKRFLECCSGKMHVKCVYDPEMSMLVIVGILRGNRPT